jgi:hypothetical protein
MKVGCGGWSPHPAFVRSHDAPHRGHTEVTGRADAVADDSSVDMHAGQVKVDVAAVRKLVAASLP